MENIRILQDSSFLAGEIPEEKRPRGFAVATNLILITKNADGQDSLLLINYEPEKWQQLFPFFSCVTDKSEFAAKTYGELIAEWQRKSAGNESVQNRMAKAKQELRALAKDVDFDFTLDGELVPVEYWLKFSKTKNIWTFYQIEFIKVSAKSEFNFANLDQTQYSLLPLDEETLSQIKASGEYQGMPIVDNTLELIRSGKIG